MMSQPLGARLAFDNAFFYGHLNRFVGSGGEMLIKHSGYEESNLTQMEIGDRLIGIGVAHVVEDMSLPPGPNSFRAVNADSPFQMKSAERALLVAGKRVTERGFEFDFKPLQSAEFSELLAQVSDDRITVPPASIPEGSFVLSVLHDEPRYSLEDMGNPSENWVAAADGDRHWNVGIGSEDDFWWAQFPSDDISILAELPPYERVGEIRFGLSMLPGSRQVPELDPVEFRHPSGRITKHHFCLSGAAVGVAGLATPFKIGLRTEILFRPVAPPT
jgi:hypothetical protein